MDQYIEEMLLKHEGERLKPYRCPAGKLTIGVGRNLDDRGITKDESRFMLKNDIKECIDDLRKIFDVNQFDKWPMDIRGVLINMRFQLGPGGFRGFRRMIRAWKRNNIAEAIKEMKDSAWYRQTPERANDLIAILEHYL